MTWSTEIRPPDSYEGDLTVQILADAVPATFADSRIPRAQYLNPSF